MPDQPVIRVVCALIRQAGRVLATRRGPGMPHAGKWEFPGGKVQADESPETAMAREIHEELCITILPVMRWASIPFQVKQRPAEMIPFECDWLSGSLTLHEHDAAEWRTLDQLPELDWLDVDRIIVDSDRWGDARP